MEKKKGTSAGESKLHERPARANPNRPEIWAAAVTNGLAHVMSRSEAQPLPSLRASTIFSSSPSPSFALRPFPILNSSHNNPEEGFASSPTYIYRLH